MSSAQVEIMWIVFTCRHGEIANREYFVGQAHEIYNMVEQRKANEMGRGLYYLVAHIDAFTAWVHY